MNWKFFMLWLSAQVWLDAAETNTVARTPARNDFEAFRVIAQRNIFNPNRSGKGSRTENPEASKTVKSESFALVGTMLYEKGQMAFFDSATARYKQVLKVGESIAGYKINEVAPNGVKLEASGKTVDLAVGQQMKRQDEGEWSVSGKAAVAEVPASSEKSASSSDDEDDVVKRLMKKREEELNK